MVQQSAQVRGPVGRCPSCGTGVPFAMVRDGQYLNADGQVIRYCPECGSALPSTPEPSHARPANLGLWLSGTIAAYVVLLGYAFSQYTFGSVYEGGTPKSITHAGFVAARIAMLISILGFGLSCWGVIRPDGNRRGWYVFAAFGAFLSLGWAGSLADASF